MERKIRNREKIKRQEDREVGQKYREIRGVRVIKGMGWRERYIEIGINRKEIQRRIERMIERR